MTSKMSVFFYHYHTYLIFIHCTRFYLGDPIIDYKVIESISDGRLDPDVILNYSTNYQSLEIKKKHLMTFEYFKRTFPSAARPMNR